MTTPGTDPIVPAGQLVPMEPMPKAAGMATSVDGWFKVGDGLTVKSLLKVIRTSQVLLRLWQQVQVNTSSADAAGGAATSAQTAADTAKANANTAVTNAATAQSRADNAYALALAGQNLPTTAIKAQVAVTNTVAETLLVSMTPASIASGASFRVKAAGMISAAVLSSALTFKLYVGNNPAPQTLVLNGTLLGTLGSLVPFSVEYIVTARTTGLYIATGSGRVASTVLGAGASTTTALSGTTIKLTAQWATAASGSSLLAETAAIEQIV